jgi:SAM-dependent methyltransferase
MRVLDLMTSWESHLPWQAGELDVVGLGMNQAELQANPQLCEFRLHDLNAVSELPFADSGFDAVVCSLSVEYLTAPLAVFRDVARVLKPGAPFVVSFSERFFPTKVIRLWQELHPFERLGLVIDYFRFAGGFENLHTESVRGYPRPQTDAYADRLSQSDAIYAVWGQRG